ncbi:MAG: phosphodiester glycosidase family protein [bacterium]
MSGVGKGFVLLSCFAILLPSVLGDSIELSIASHITSSGWADVYVLRVDLNDPRVYVVPALSFDRIGGRETTSSIAKRKGAEGAVNASFYAQTGHPLGMVMIDRRLISEPILNRTVMGITRDGRTVWGNPTFRGRCLLNDREIPVHRINSVRRNPSDNILYTREFASRTPVNSGVDLALLAGFVIGVFPGGGAVVPDAGYVLSLGRGEDVEVGVGDQIFFDWGLEPGWDSVVHAIGGGPRLIKNGEVFITAQEEGFRPDVFEGVAPRTAVGVTEDNHLLLVVVDGRRLGSVGISLRDLAKLMLSLGAYQAMNLDGGGSSTMVYRGRVVNIPSDGRERPVSAVILVYYKRGDGESAENPSR